MEKYWGYHLILDIAACDIEKITNPKNIEKFVKILIEKIDMKAFKEPLIHHFATHNADAAGYSLVQLIETSSITGHFVDKTGDAYIDIFSCKEFSQEIVIKVVEEFFSPKSVKATFLTRQA